MPEFINLVGQRFHRLVVLEYAGVKKYSKGKHTAWICRCDCGSIITTTTNGLRTGNTKSCGCWRREFIRPNKTHGKSGTRTFHSWCAMRNRCNNPKATGYKNYGGRGIRVCARWEKFTNFLADMGEAPEGMSIERKDNNGNYEPSNCKWATRKEQNANYRGNHVVEFRGKHMIIKDWALETGIPALRIVDRLNTLGWSVERTLTTPARKIRRVTTR